MLSIKRLPLGTMAANCYLVYDAKGSAIIIDPGDEAEFISRIILEKGLRPQKIIATHGHFDHILAAPELKLAFGIPFYASKKDSSLISKMPERAKRFLGETPLPLKIDSNIKEGDRIRVGKYVFEVLETPGHTPGSICLFEKKERALFVGDLVFRDGSVGRYDFPYSDKARLYKSVKKILGFPDKTILYPGHGEEVLIKELKEVRHK
ncbi:MBL fold metallo-hydrolase [Candidatus Woesebacteria bacterium]|nr:MBL fold metallo-hydrolase [Candidatus Woesebacteria bacterium]